MKYYDCLTDFIFVEDVPEPSDAIFITGNRYGELAVKAAELYAQHMADWIVPARKYSITVDGFQGPLSPKEYLGRTFETESDFFEAVLLEHGVPGEAILRENQSVFTYENAIYTRSLLEKEQIYQEGRPFQAILVCQAFHARRSLMYYQLVFQDTRFLVCPVETQGISRNNWFENREKIDVVLGEVERCGSQFHDIMKGTDQIWKGRKQK